MILGCFLGFYCCDTGTTEEEWNEFLNLLRRLASHQLTHFSMSQSNWDISILDLLFVCPHLTHFTFQASGSRYFKPIQLLPNAQISYKALIYFRCWVDSQTIEHQVQTVISRSPNLRYFIGSDMPEYNVESNTLTSLEFVLTKCPQLKFYIGDGSYCDKDDFISEILALSSVTPLLLGSATVSNSHSSNSKDLQRRQMQQVPFHTLAVCDNDNPNQIIFHLWKYRNTLKRLRLIGAAVQPEDNPSDWTDTFQTIPMQQLHTLHCVSLNCRIESIVTLLNTCRNTIQQVKLHYLKYQLLDVSLLQQLQSLPQLRALSLYNAHFADESSVLTLLDRLPSLETLIVQSYSNFALTAQAAPFLKNLRQWSLASRILLHRLLYQL